MEIGDAGEPGTSRQWVSIESTATGVFVDDDVTNCRYVLATDSDYPPVREVPPGEMDAPVERAAVVDAAELTCDELVVPWVSEGPPGAPDQIRERDRVTLSGRLLFDLSAAVKVYVAVEGTVTVDTHGRTRFEFDDDTAVRVGARSLHERPGATVRTTDDPRAAMRALSTFGSGLKSTTPDRSWPTLRGHPPDVVVGDATVVPEGVGPPCPSVELRVPPAPEYVLPVASLAYYLGAAVRPGSPPRLVADGSLLRRFPAATDRRSDDRPATPFERAVERTLERVFVLEVAARSEGFTEAPVVERPAVADAVDLDLADCYHCPPAERLDRFLSVPHEAVADQVPRWTLAAYLPRRFDRVEALPYLAYDLARVRTDPTARRSSPGPATDDRSPSPAGSSDGRQSSELPGSPESSEWPGSTRPLPSSTVPTPADLSLSDGSRPTGDTVGDAESAPALPGTDAVDTVWVGDRTPPAGSWTDVAALRRGRSADPTDPPVECAVVCNDPDMAREVTALDYGRDWSYPLTVTERTNLSTAELRDLIVGEVDFLHYVGHATPAGLRCRDGHLDVGDLPETGVRAFVLNACRSRRQGRRLLERGAVGGVVTADEVSDAGAVAVGRTVGRALNAGYRLREAADIAGDRLAAASYLVVGDGSYRLTRRDDVPTTCRIGAARDRQPASGNAGTGSGTGPDPDPAPAWELRVDCYHRSGLGSVYTPHVEDAGWRLQGNATGTMLVDQEELAAYLDLGPGPVRIATPGGRELAWSPDLSVDDLPDRVVGLSPSDAGPGTD